MRTARFAAIWAAGMLVITLLVNLAGGLITKRIGSDQLMPAMTGYSKKMQFPLEEARTEEERKHNAVALAMRAVLSDQHFENTTANRLTGMLLFTDLTIDQSNVYIGEAGPTPFSSGIFQSVYRETGERIHMGNVIGLVDLRAFILEDGADALHEALSQTPDAAVRLDAYTMEDYLITPARLSLLDAQGNVLTQIDCPAQGEILKAEDLYLENSGAGNDYDSNNLLCQLENAQLGERRTDRIADRLAQQTDPSGGYVMADIQVHYGFGRITSEFTEVNNHTAGICVVEFDYHRSLILYIAVLGGILTLILGIVYFVKR